MIYMMGWGSGTNGPSGVFRALECAAKEEDIRDISFVSMGANHLDDLRNVLSILKKKQSVIAVHSGHHLWCCLIYLISRINRSNRYYMIVHGIYKLEYQYLSEPVWYANILEKILYKRFDNLICVSDMCRKYVKELYGREKNVYAINNGYTAPKVDPVFRDNIETIKLVSLGGIRRRKGIFETVELIEYLNNCSELEVQLDIYGHNWDEDYKQFEKITGNINNIQYKGLITNKTEMFQLLAEYDIHLSLSLWDTFNIAIPEALSVGVPTICSNTCGASVYVKDNENGLVIDLKGNYNKKVLDYITKYISDKEFRRSNKQEAVISVSNDTWDQVIHRYNKLLSDNSI